MVRSGSGHEEYITLNIDNNTGPTASTSAEELRQNPENVENVRNLDPIYEYCTTTGAAELRKSQVVVAVWELSPVKFIITRFES